MAERKHTILVVDDDPGVRKVLGQWVERLGYQLESADSAEAAVNILENHDVDVALCDIRMPGADGIWLADRIRERFPTVAVVLATGLNEMDPSITLRPGVVAYVVKPFGHNEIAGAIKTGIAWREAQMPRSHTPTSFRLIEGMLNDRS
jgi:CheY-like chemotaxis protein